MCSVGDTFNLDDLATVESENYICKDCNNKFKAIGNKASCPSCGSKNVTKE